MRMPRQYPLLQSQEFLITHGAVEMTSHNCVFIFILLKKLEDFFFHDWRKSCSLAGKSWLLPLSHVYFFLYTTLDRSRVCVFYSHDQHLAQEIPQSTLPADVCRIDSQWCVEPTPIGLPEPAGCISSQVHIQELPLVAWKRPYDRNICSTECKCYKNQTSFPPTPIHQRAGY